VTKPNLLKGEDAKHLVSLRLIGFSFFTFSGLPRILCGESTFLKTFTRKEIAMKKKTLVLVMIMLTGILFLPQHFLLPEEALGQTGAKVLMIPREGFSNDLDLMLTKEIGVMTSMLKDAGFEVVVATRSGSPLIGSKSTLKPDKRLDQVNLNDYVGVVLACMAVGGIPGPPIAPEAIGIVQQAVAAGKPVTAQMGAVIILAHAGVLKGKKYTYPADPTKFDPAKPSASVQVADPKFNDAIYSGKGVIQDGVIITSAVCPNIEKVTKQQGIEGYIDGTPELTRMLISSLKKK
jgi:putative intracellular protease/amidase